MENSNLWKDIGVMEEDEFPKGIYNGKHPQLKGYQLQFASFSRSDSGQEQPVNIKKLSSFSLHSSEGKQEEEDLHAPIMIMTEQLQVKKEQEQQVIEAISFGSEVEEKVQSKHIKTLDKIKQQPRSNDMISVKQYEPKKSIKCNRCTEKIQKTKLIRKKLNIIQSSVIDLKKELDQYKFYLLNVLSGWELNAIRDCQKMSQNIDKRFGEVLLNRQRLRQKQMRTVFQSQKMSRDLTVQLNQIKQQLEQEKGKNRQYKREMGQMELKLAKSLASSISKQNSKEQKNTIKQDYARQHLSKIEKDLFELRIQKEQNSRQILKSKDTLREKEYLIKVLNEENENYRREIASLKMQLQQSSGRQRKLEMKIELSQQKYQQEHLHLEVETNKSRQQMLKLKELLKNSQQQLRQCESYISSLMKKISTQEESINHLNSKVKEEQALYFKKLQSKDQALTDIQRTIEQMTKNYEIRAQEIIKKQIQHQKVKKELEARETDLRRKQFQIEELKQELKHEMILMERREQGMRAEYKMAVDAQQASKDKWYQRYQRFAADHQDKSKYSSSPTLPSQRMTANYAQRPSFTKKTYFNLPVKQKSSPVKSIILSKAKSERNFGVGSPKVKRMDMFNSKNADFTIPEAYRDSGITNRINNLRAELSKQLSQINVR